MDSTHRRESALDAQSVVDTAVGTVRQLHDRNRLLFWVAVLNVGLSLLFAVLMQVDGRTVVGRNVWTKPWKFATSIAVFTGTIGWILPSLSLRDAVERRVSRLVGGAMVVEITLISVQAARAVQSHFNTTTPVDGVLFGVMGLTITLNTAVVAYVLWRVVRQPPSLAPAYQWGLRLGLFLFVAASLEGWLMIARGGHAVAAPEAGPGLPVINWSLTGGDLRIAHFLGLHALQVVPLTGYLASRWQRVSSRGALSVVGAVASLYAGLTVVVFLTALQGIPLFTTVPTLSMATVFAGSFLSVAPVWALLILAPTWRVTERIAASPLVAVPAALLYAALVVPRLGSVAGEVLSPSLGGMSALLATDAGATVAWVHFLAFDLFVGRWIYLDARRRDLSPLVVSPVLCVTLLFGPLGFLVYTAVRAVHSVSLGE